MNTEALEIGLRLIGGFYVFAGVVGMRAMVMDHVMDQMLASLSFKPIPLKDSQRRWLLSFSILAIGMGGAALMVLSLWAVPLFLIGAATQAIYLIWARTAFPADNEAERTGRSQTTNAALIYAAATVLVCLAAGSGLLHPWLDPWAALIPIFGVALLVMIGRHFIWQAARIQGWPEANSEDYPEDTPIPPLHRIRLDPRWGGETLLDADTGAGVDYDLYVTNDLGNRIYAWARAFHAGDDHEVREFWVQFADSNAEASHRAEAAAIVSELKAEFGESNVEGPVYPPDLRYAGATGLPASQGRQIEH